MQMQVPACANILVAFVVCISVPALSSARGLQRCEAAR